MAGSTFRSLHELSAEVATNPNSTAFVELATVYRERGDLERAKRLCLRGLQRHPTHVEAHFELGRIYEAQGERELALDEWSIVRQLAPDHIPSRRAAVRLFIEEGRRAEAERELRDARRLAPEDETLARLWEQLRELRREDAALEAAELFEHLEREQAGTLGVLLVDAGGEVLAGKLRARAVASDGELSLNLSGARSEAERVASYLQLGCWRAMVVEGKEARLAVSPVRGGVIIVATAPDVPAGRAARVVRRAREIADVYLTDRAE